MTLLEEGTLADKLIEFENGLPEEQVRKYFLSLILAVHYCHEKANIAHRDIKPENLMLDKNDNLYLCDFGVSQFFTNHKDDKLEGTRGTYLFMAPEIVKPGLPKQVFGRQVDVWACGVTLFNLLTGKYPFNGKSLPVL